MRIERYGDHYTVRYILTQLAIAIDPWKVLTRLEAALRGGYRRI